MGRTGLQSSHPDALRYLAPAALIASRHLERFAPQRLERHLLGLPHGSGISGAAAGPPAALSPAAPSAFRHRPAAAGDIPAAVPRAVRHPARAPPRTAVDLADRPRPGAGLRHARPAAGLGARAGGAAAGPGGGLDRRRLD